MNGEQKTRYHAEVKIIIEGREARINVFADTLNEIFLDIGTICSQFPQDWMNPAKWEILNAELKAKQLANEQHPRTPVCKYCNSDKDMELVEFTDKKTGELRKAWKCQACKKWHWPENGKKRSGAIQDEWPFD